MQYKKSKMFIGAIAVLLPFTQSLAQSQAGGTASLTVFDRNLSITHTRDADFGGVVIPKATASLTMSCEAGGVARRTSDNLFTQSLPIGRTVQCGEFIVDAGTANRSFTLYLDNTLTESFGGSSYTAVTRTFTVYDNAGTALTTIPIGRSSRSPESAVQSLSDEGTANFYLGGTITLTPEVAAGTYTARYELVAALQ